MLNAERQTLNAERRTPKAKPRISKSLPCIGINALREPALNVNLCALCVSPNIARTSIIVFVADGEADQ